MTNLESRIIERLNPDLSADDCALIEHGGQSYLYTTDSLAEGTHFRLDWSSPEDIAFKLVQVNLSDLAAAGGEPEFCLLNLGLPENADEDLIGRFAAALREQLSDYRCKLVGGDTFRANGYLFSLTLSGPALYPRFRRANSNDGIFLSGHVGMSRLGYEILNNRKKGKKPVTGETVPLQQFSEQATESGKPVAANGDIEAQAIQRHLRPRANLEAARQINALQSHSFPVSGAMDLSDGVFADCQRFAESSGLNLTVHLEKLPMLQAVAAYGPEFAASSGEELELLVACSRDLPEGFVRIGEFEESAQEPVARFLLNGQEAPSHPGFEHFREPLQ